MDDNPFNKLNNDYQRIKASPEWDAFFKNTRKTDVQSRYWEKFDGIKTYYETYRELSPDQANTVRWAIKKKHSRGVSRRSFRGISRGVYEGIY